MWSSRIVAGSSCGSCGTSLPSKARFRRIIRTITVFPSLRRAAERKLAEVMIRSPQLPQSPLLPPSTLYHRNRPRAAGLWRPRAQDSRAVLHIRRSGRSSLGSSGSSEARCLARTWWGIPPTTKITLRQVQGRRRTPKQDARSQSGPTNACPPSPGCRPTLQVGVLMSSVASVANSSLHEDHPSASSGQAKNTKTRRFLQPRPACPAEARRRGMGAADRGYGPRLQSAPPGPPAKAGQAAGGAVFSGKIGRRLDTGPNRWYIT